MLDLGAPSIPPCRDQWGRDDRLATTLQRGVPQTGVLSRGRDSACWHIRVLAFWRLNRCFTLIEKSSKFARAMNVIYAVLSEGEVRPRPGEPSCSTIPPSAFAIPHSPSDHREPEWPACRNFKTNPNFSPKNRIPRFQTPIPSAAPGKNMHQRTQPRHAHRCPARNYMTSHQISEQSGLKAALNTNLTCPSPSKGLRATKAGARKGVASPSCLGALLPRCLG